MFIVHSVKCRIEFVGNLLHLQYPICSMVLNIYQHLPLFKIAQFCRQIYQHHGSHMGTRGATRDPEGQIMKYGAHCRLIAHEQHIQTFVTCGSL